MAELQPGGIQAPLTDADWKSPVADGLNRLLREEEAQGNQMPVMGSPEFALKINRSMLEEKWMDETERELMKEKRKKKRDERKGFLEIVRVQHLLLKDRIKEREAREVIDAEERQERWAEQEKRGEME